MIRRLDITITPGIRKRLFVSLASSRDRAFVISVFGACARLEESYLFALLDLYERIARPGDCGAGVRAPGAGASALSPSRASALISVFRVVGSARAGRATRAASPSARRCCAAAASDAAAAAVRRRAAGLSADVLRAAVDVAL